MRRSFFLSSVLALSLAAAPSAFAEPPPAPTAPAPPPPQGGCTAQREAYRADPKPSAAAALALAECTQADSPREAAAALAPLLHPGAATGDERTRAEQLYANVRQRVGAISIEVDTRRADVTVDGVSAGRSPLAEAVFVAPGHHVIVAKTDDGAVARREVDVGLGQVTGVVLRTIALEADAIGYDVPSGAAAGAPPRERAKSIPIVIAGAAVALIAVGVGVAFTVVANGKAGNVNDDQNALLAGSKTTAPCASPQTSAIGIQCTTLKNDLTAKDNAANLAAGAYVVAGLAAVATAAYLFWPDTQKHRASFAARPVPMVGPGLGGVGVVGVF